LRGYTGKAVVSTVLEVVIRPPIVTMEKDVEATGGIEELMWDLVERVFVQVESDGSKANEVGEEELKSDEEAAPGVTVQNEANYASSTNDDIITQPSKSLNKKLGMDFENVGGLDAQLDDIARRVLASRANPEAARRLGVSRVRGILLSGPPGCGKTLLARELSRLLGAREPQIVNGPEILDKFIGEAERRVRDLFAPAEREYDEVGDASALHLIILDEIDAIARKRGSMTSDTTGVRDSVVNQLLAKIDGVKEASNILVVGLTNRPELIDPALLRPGRLEVQLRVELPGEIHLKHQESPYMF
jgi:vesicle-fusing ATPase